MTITPAPASRLDSPNMIVAVCAAVGALIVTLAMLGLVDMQEQQRLDVGPLDPPAFVHPEPIPTVVIP